MANRERQRGVSVPSIRLPLKNTRWTRRKHSMHSTDENSISRDTDLDSRMDAGRCAAHSRGNTNSDRLPPQHNHRTHNPATPSPNTQSHTTHKPATPSLNTQFRGTESPNTISYTTQSPTVTQSCSLTKAHYTITGKTSRHTDRDAHTRQGKTETTKLKELSSHTRHTHTFARSEHNYK